MRDGGPVVAYVNLLRHDRIIGDPLQVYSPCITSEKGIVKRETGKVKREA